MRQNGIRRWVSVGLLTILGVACAERAPLSPLPEAVDYRVGLLIGEWSREYATGWTEKDDKTGQYVSRYTLSLLSYTFYENGDYVRVWEAKFPGESNPRRVQQFGWYRWDGGGVLRTQIEEASDLAYETSNLNVQVWVKVIIFRSDRPATNPDILVLGDQEGREIGFRRTKGAKDLLYGHGL